MTTISPITIIDENNLLTVDADLLKQAAQTVLALETSNENDALTIIIMDLEAMQALNAQYRGIEEPTDILSFVADPIPEELMLEDEAQYLGDMMLCPPYIAERHQDMGHSIDNEYQLLVVHGVLHLLGYDHDTEATQSIMWRQQAHALDALNIALEVPDYIHDDST